MRVQKQSILSKLNNGSLERSPSFTQESPLLECEISTEEHTSNLEALSRNIRLCLEKQSQLSFVIREISDILKK